MEGIRKTTKKYQVGYIIHRSRFESCICRIQIGNISAVGALSVLPSDTMVLGLSPDWPWPLPWI